VRKRRSHWKNAKRKKSAKRLGYAVARRKKAREIGGERWKSSSGIRSLKLDRKAES